MKTKKEKWIEECRCYGVNKEWGKQHCPIHRYTKSPKDCEHSKISIDEMDEKGNHRCRECGVYVLPKWKDNLNRRYAFKMHLTGRWLYYLVDDNDEETIYGFLDNWIVDIIQKYVQSERERIIKEIKVCLNSSHHVLPQNFEGYSNKYHNLIANLEELIENLKTLIK